MSHPVKKSLSIGAAAAFTAVVATFGLVSWKNHEVNSSQVWNYIQVQSVKITGPTAP
jgi:hypothetical protein